MRSRLGEKVKGKMKLTLPEEAKARLLLAAITEKRYLQALTKRGATTTYDFLLTPDGLLPGGALLGGGGGGGERLYNQLQLIT